MIKAILLSVKQRSAILKSQIQDSSTISKGSSGGAGYESIEVKASLQIVSNKSAVRVEKRFEQAENA